MPSPSTVLLNPQDWLGRAVCLNGRIGNIGFRSVIYDDPAGSWTDQQATQAYRQGVVLRFPGLMRALYAAYPIMYGTHVWEIKRVCVTGMIRRSTVDTHRWMIDDIQHIEFLPGSGCRETAPQFITPEYVQQCQQAWIDMAKREAKVMPELVPCIAKFEHEATVW